MQRQDVNFSNQQIDIKKFDIRQIFAQLKSDFNLKNNYGSKKKLHRRYQKSSKQNQEYENNIKIQQTIRQFQNQISEEESDQNNNDDSNRRVQQLDIALAQEEKTVKQSTIVSYKYLKKILKLEYPHLLLTFIISLLIIIIQINVEIDEKCDPVELANRLSRESTDNKCPLGSYIVINLRYLIINFWAYYISFLFIVNNYQLTYRKLVQYIASAIIIAYIAQKIYYQYLNVNFVINEVVIIFTLSSILFNLVARHSIGFLVYMIASQLSYHIVWVLLNVLAVYLKLTRNFYLILIFQYATIIVKKVSQGYLRNKLKYNLQYDDVNIVYIVTVIYEYIFIFDFILVQDNSWFRQLLTILNFIIIQIKNINNVSVFYLVYNYLTNKGLIFLQGVVIIQYILVVFFAIYQLFLHIQYFIQLVAVKLWNCVCIRFLQKLFSKDNESAQERHFEAAVVNGYIDQKIDEQDIDHFTCQQTIIAFYYFQLYLIVLIITRVVCAKSESTKTQYKLIEYFKYSDNSNLTVLNLVLFSTLISVLMILMVLKKGQKEVKVVRQTIRQQIVLVQILLSLGLIELITRDVFEIKLMRIIMIDDTI